MRRVLIALILVLWICPGLYAQAPEADVYGPVVSGFFYPRSEDKLREMIDSFLTKTQDGKLPGRPMALISPHAGYDYSGAVAAQGYNALKGATVKRVIILAPSHYGKRYRGASVLMASRYKTPLGLVEIDQEVCKALIEKGPLYDTNPLFGYYAGAYKNEHSLETQLPFLQMVLGDFKLVPVLLGILMDNDFEKVAAALRPYLDDSTLVVASSDFTHYGERFAYVPFRQNIEENIKNLDNGAIDRILSLDFDGLMRYRDDTGITVCGFVPIAVLLKLLPKDVQGKLLYYDTSGRMTKDFSNSVSYTSIIFTKQGEKKASKAREPMVVRLVVNPPKAENLTGGAQSGSLTQGEAEVILDLARNTLESYTKTKKLPEIDEPNLSPRLREKSGVFVTLHKAGDLRGCIGHILPRLALWQAVVECTVSSAAKDGRFSPVRAEELKDIEIEVSVLSPLRRIQGPEEFLVGREGIMIKLGQASAVFLPQVATEQGWDRDETLNYLCRKAGLPWNAWWNKDMEFYVFTTEVFHERVPETTSVK